LLADACYASKLFKIKPN